MKLTGLVYININGQRVRSEKDASLKPGGAIQKAGTDATGFIGHYTEENKPGEVKFSIQHGDDTDIVTMQGLRDVNVLFETDSGQTYLVRGAATEGEVEQKGRMLEITMTGAPAERV